MEDICGRMGDNWWTRQWAFHFSQTYMYNICMRIKKNIYYLFRSWKHFEDKYVCWLLMKSDARKHKDPIFGAFHKLNLEDAAKYVSEVRAELFSIPSPVSISSFQ